MNAVTTTALTSPKEKTRAQRVRLYLLSCMATTMATPAFAQLTEGEDTAGWVLSFFSPVLLLTLLTILLIGCGLAVWMGRMNGQRCATPRSCASL